ncbi:hypothetical protein D3C84_990070 [compost metagenome]
MLGQHRTQAAGGDNQWRQHGGPGETKAQQQAEQNTVVTEQPGLAIGLGIAATLGGEQSGDAAQQRTAEQGGRGEKNRQQAQQTAQRVTLEEDLAEAVEQGCGPVGAVGVEVVGRHDGVCGFQLNRVACFVGTPPGASPLPH